LRKLDNLLTGERGEGVWLRRETKEAWSSINYLIFSALPYMHNSCMDRLHLQYMLGLVKISRTIFVLTGNRKVFLLSL
jgi:hypothetical protein